MNLPQSRLKSLQSKHTDYNRVTRLKRTSVTLLAFVLALGLSLNALAGDIDLVKWNTEGTLYTVLNDDGVHSNSAVVMAFLRTDYDRPSNRIRMLFSLELDSFTDESKSGVRMSVSGGEDIVLRADGTAEYNKEEYFAQMITDSDPRTKTLYLEVTLGIKRGIPDPIILDFNFYDTQGIASNTYTIDITEANELQTLSEDGQTATQRTKKNNSSDNKKPIAENTQASSQEKPTQTEASVSATQPHNLGGQVINITAKDRAFAVVAGIATVTLGSMGGFYLIRRKNGG